MKLRHYQRAIIALTSISLPLLSQAANVTWDADTGTTGAQDGPGTWDISSANWWTGAADALFSITTPDTPTFGNASGAAGIVTLGANVVSGNMTFNAPGAGNYIIAGGGFALTLTNRTITANASATISANIVPSGGANSSLTLANNGGAVLTLSGNNSFTNFNLGSNLGNTTAAVRAGSSTAFGYGNIGIAGGQGSQTSQRIELVGNNLTITNTIANLGRNNQSAVVVNLGTGNVMSGTQTKTSGGQDVHFASEVASGLTFSGAAGGGIALASSVTAPRFFVLRGTGGGVVSGVITNGSGANSVGIVKAGSGAWTLSGANTYTNATIVDEGTLTLDYSSANNSKLADQSPLTLGGGNVNLSGGTHTEVVLSTALVAGNSSVTRSTGASMLRLNAITRNRGSVINFGAANIADTDTLNVNGILGGYATIAGTDWAMNSTGAADGAITAYSSYTDIAAGGSIIADGAATNVRLNSAGTGVISPGSTTTTINTLLQNTTTFATVDTFVGMLRLGATGGILVPNGKQGLAIGTAANSGLLTAGGADNTSGEIIVINNSANPVVINSTITNNGTGITSFTKSGSGSATLAGSNTHTGTNSIVGGTLNVSDDSNFGTVPGAATVGSILINGGVLNATASFTLNPNRGVQVGPPSRYGNGTIGVASGQTLTCNGIIANADTTGNGPGGSLTKIGNGTLILGGINTYSSGTIINGGTVSITASGNLGPQPLCYIPDHLVVNGGTLEAAATLTLGNIRGIQLGPVGGSGSGTFQVDDSVSLQLDSRIADNWNGTGSLVKTGNGTLILTSGFNDYSGNTTVSAGNLQINNARSIPNGAGKGNVTVNGTLNINGVNVQLNGMTGNGTVDNTTGTAITLGVGNNNQGGTFSGTIQNSGGGALTLAKAGSATITLTGANNHTGGTLINSGTLALTGSATIASTTNIAVGSGATFDVGGLFGSTLTLNGGQTLSGNGIVNGLIDVGSGAVAPGASAGTLTVSGIYLNGGGSLNYELANVTTVGSGVNDLITVGGLLTISGTTTLNLTYLNGIPASSGKYTLIGYGAYSGPADITGTFTVPSGFTITNNTSTKTIDLLINHTSANLTWRGDGASDIWDIDATPNWIQAGSPVTFFNGDTANFDDTGSNSPPIFISTPVIAAAVNVSSSQNYDFTGSSIASAGLTKSGAGTLILENDNNYNNGALISSGTVQIGNNGVTGTLTGGGITNNGALVVNRLGDVLLASAISGSGSVSQINSAGTTALSASNSYSGATLVTAGRLYARNSSAFGDTSSGTTVSADAQIYIDQNVNFGAEPLTLNGNGLNGGGDGALRKGAAGVTIYGGPVMLGSDTTINIDGNATLNLTNGAGITSASVANLILTGGGGSQGTVAGQITLGTGSLTKSGGGTWTIARTNTYTGKTFINGGTLFTSDGAALGPVPGVWTPDYITFGGGSLGVTTNAGVLSFAFADAKRGLTFNGNGGFNVGPGATLTLSNEMTGFGNLSKSGAGTLVLVGSNSFSGVLYLDRFADGNNNDGVTRLTTTNAIANVTEIRSRNTSVNTAGGCTLQLDGSKQNLLVSQPMWLSCRQPQATNATIENLAATNTLTGAINITAGGTAVNWEADANTRLLINGDIQYNDTLLAPRTMLFMGEGETIVNGSILASANGVTPVGVTKMGTGKVTLAGVNTYPDNTTVSNGLLLLTGSISSTGVVTVAGGTLAGTGTINAIVNELSAGTLAPGASVGTLTINSDLNLAGNLAIEVNKSLAQSNDVIIVSGGLTNTGAGTLTVSNLGPALVVGDRFNVFSQPVVGGSAITVVGSGVTWTNQLAVDGSISVLSTVSMTPTPISFSLSGNTLTLSWPADHLSWVLQAQTNGVNVGLTPAWFDVAGSGSSTQAVYNINPANPTVFFRLRSP